MFVLWASLGDVAGLFVLWVFRIDARVVVFCFCSNSVVIFVARGNDGLCAKAIKSQNLVWAWIRRARRVSILLCVSAGRGEESRLVDISL